MTTDDENTYTITVYAISRHAELPISKTEFEAIQRARKVIGFAISVEEKFDLLMENYADLERELVEMSLQNSIFPGFVERLLDNATQRSNRRIINLLTSFRLYHDHITHHISETFGRESDILESFKSEAHKQYDSSIGYRALEALRNHVQHYNLPTNSITFNSNKVFKESDDGEKTFLLGHSTIIYVLIEDLEANPKFKKSVLNDLKKLAEKGQVHLLPLVREYIECLGRLQHTLREASAIEVKSAVDLIKKHRQSYEESFKRIPVGLAAIERDSRGIYTSHEYLSERGIRIWKDLLRKNSDVRVIKRKFVTSEQIVY